MVAGGNGAFYLVSVGIGDPENITLRAQRIIRSADIVFAMGFVAAKFPDLLAGKAVYDAGHSFFEDRPMNNAGPGDEDRVRKIVREGVAAGKTVAVLDFGDPMLYSPQAGYLREFADLSPKVVPGISSFNAASAALGVHLSGKGDRAIVLTGAVRGNKALLAQMKKLAKAQPTLVFFTMKMDLPEVCRVLCRCYPSDTPACIVCYAGEWGRESLMRGTLETIVEQAAAANLPWEHLLYVGDFLDADCRDAP